MSAADLAFHNGKIITLDSRGSIAEAVSIRNGVIESVGKSESVLKTVGSNTRMIDLKGRTLTPGFVDCHPHMDREGLKTRGGVPLVGLRSVGDIVAAVADAVKRARLGAWVVLMPMGDPPHDYISHPSQLKEGRFPTRHDLDPVSPDNPVCIRVPWGWWSKPPFPSVVNSLALREAGITRDTPAPYKVEILKDSQGEPTGVFLERNRAPVLNFTLLRKLPRFTYQDRVEAVRCGSRLYSAAGTTSLYEGHGLTPELIRAYHEVEQSGDLAVRLYTPISIPSASKSDAELEDLIYQWSAVAGSKGEGSEQVRVAGITLDLADPHVADIIGTGYPYDEWAGHFHQGLSDERFVKLGVHAVRLGLRLNALICYDLERAIRLFEAIDREVSIRDMRCVGIHLLTATEDQLHRIRDLGLVVTMTPGLLYQHAQEFGIDHLADGAVPIRRVLDASIPVALATDNVPYQMLWVMWEALARWNGPLNCRLGESYLSREEVLKLAVSSGHYLVWREGKAGSIEPGKAADLILLDGDPLTCDLHQMPNIPVDMTVMNGRVVNERH